MSRANMSEPKRTIIKEIAPIIEKFDRMKIIPHYEDEC